MTKVADEWKADDDECHNGERLFHTISGKQGCSEMGDSGFRSRLRLAKTEQYLEFLTLCGQTVGSCLDDARRR
jgi:hypothetical protein